MKNLFISLFFCVLLIIIGIASLYGVLIPKNNPVKAVGSMQLAPFENGLALYQQDKPYYYGFSPYNDYVISGVGTRSSLITVQELNDKRFSTDFKISYLAEIKNALLNFFNLDTPGISYSTENYQISYQSKLDSKSVLINRKINIKNDKIPPISGMTMTYAGSDFIYDQSGHLYNFQNNEDLTLFEKLYGIHLEYQAGEPRISVGDKTILIMNPLIASVMVISAKENQSLYINRDNRIIEVEGTPNRQGKEITDSIRISVYQNPQEAEKSL